MQFDDLEFNHFHGTWHLTVSWGFYCKTFTGESQVECVNQLIEWCSNR